MPVKPYDDRKVSLWRPHGNGDLDIVRASYTRRKANVTEALQIDRILIFKGIAGWNSKLLHQIFLILILAASCFSGISSKTVC